VRQREKQEGRCIKFRMKFKRAAGKSKEKSEDATAGNLNQDLTRVAKTRGAQKANSQSNQCPV
jgi:hypothetical protein